MTALCYSNSTYLQENYLIENILFQVFEKITTTIRKIGTNVSSFNDRENKFKDYASISLEISDFFELLLSNKKKSFRKTHFNRWRFEEHLKSFNADFLSGHIFIFIFMHSIFFRSKYFMEPVIILPRSDIIQVA